MPAAPASATPRLAFDELPLRRRNIYYVFAVGRRANEQKSTQRYLRLFARFDKGQGPGRFLAWNWSVFFCTFPWLAYRRMPGLALLYFILVYLLAPIQIFAWHRSCPGETGIPFAVAVAWLPFAFLLMPAICDRIYHRRARRIAMEAYEKRYDPKIGTSASSAGKITVACSIVFLVFFSTVGGYQPVSHQVEMGYAVRGAVTAEDQVAAFYAEQGRLPRQGEIGPWAPNARIRSMTAGDGGVITIVSNLRCFEGKSIVYTPTVTNGRVSWKCSTPDIDLRFLPAECARGR